VKYGAFLRLEGWGGGSWSLVAADVTDRHLNPFRIKRSYARNQNLEFHFSRVHGGFLDLPVFWGPTLMRFFIVLLNDAMLTTEVI
jgi:hypothetical protein